MKIGPESVQKWTETGNSVVTNRAQRRNEVGEVWGQERDQATRCAEGTRGLGEVTGQGRKSAGAITLAAPYSCIAFGSMSISVRHSMAFWWIGPLGNSRGGLGEGEEGESPGSGAWAAHGLERKLCLIMGRV